MKNDAIQHWIFSVNEATNKVCTDESLFSKFCAIYGGNDDKRNVCEGENEHYRKLISKYMTIEETSDSDKSVIEDSFCNEKVENNVEKPSRKDLESYGKVDECDEKPQDLENSYEGKSVNRQILKTITAYR